MNTKQFIELIIAVLLWGLSALFVTKFTNTINNIMSIPILVLYMLGISLLIQILKLIWTNNITEISISITKLKKSNIIYFSKLALLGFCLYPSLYFYALSGNDLLKSNALNYIWPIIAFLFQFCFYKKEYETLDVTAFALSIIGTILIFSSNINSEYNITSYTISAVIGAFCYGIYTGLLANIRNNENLLNINHNSRFFILTSLSFVFILFFVSISFFLSLYYKEININLFLEINELKYLAIYSVLSFSLSQCLWSKINSEVHADYSSTVVFITPAISTFILSISRGDKVDYVILLGLIIIMVSIILIQRKDIFSKSNSTIYSLSIAIIVTLLFFLFKRITIENTLSINENISYLQVTIALFSIHYSFLMLQVNNEKKNMIDMICEIYNFDLRKYLSKKDKENLHTLINRGNGKSIREFVEELNSYEGNINKKTILNIYLIQKKLSATMSG